MTDFHTGLGKNPANYQPLTPIDFIIRSARSILTKPPLSTMIFSIIISSRVGAKLLSAAVNYQMACANWVSIKTTP